MLLTTCPNCGAKFKVSPEQLNVRQGRVMCGRCRHVFNAFEALKRIQDTDTTEPIDYALVDSRRSTTADEPVPPPEARAETPIVTPLEETVADAAEEATDATDAERDEREAREAREARDAFDSYEEALKKLEQAETGVEPETTHEILPTAAEIAPMAQLAETAPTVEPTYAAASDNPLISGSVRRDAAPSRVWGWLAAIAAVIFLAQTLYYFRSAIVQQYPQLRPQFAMACEVIGCRVSWGRNQELIKIESSDLIEPPGKPGRILLTATLINRGVTKQDFPSLEVKLTDANNGVVSSRILTPVEYLGRFVAADEGLSPNVELYVNLNLELVGKTPASGYGLRAFYPE